MRIRSLVVVVGACTAPLLLAALAAAGCPPGAGSEAYLRPGPWGVGQRTLELLDPSRDTPAHGPHPARSGRVLVTEVWYPSADAAPGAPPVREADAARGRFPLVVDAHGFSDFRDSRAYYAAALASRGYVVAAPEFPVTSLRSGAPRNVDTPSQPGDVRFVVDTLLDVARTRGSWLAARLDRHRVALSGYSNGGTTALLASFHATLRDERVRAVAVVAPGSCYLTERFFRAARPPLLVVAGDDDAIVERQPDEVFATARSPRTLVRLLRGTHAGFLGFLTAPSESSYDAIACSALDVLPPDAFVFDPERLGGARAGIDPARCSVPCQEPLPPGPPMPAPRQQELTAASLVAFFDATLKRSSRARCFLDRGLAAENADVRVEREAANGLPRRAVSPPVTHTSRAR